MVEIVNGTLHKKVAKLKIWPTSYFQYYIRGNQAPYLTTIATQKGEYWLIDVYDTKTLA